MDFEIVVETTSPGYSKSRPIVRDRFTGTEPEAIVYAYGCALEHAKTIHGAFSSGHVSRNSRGASFRTNAGTLIQYSSIQTQSESE